MGPIAAAAESEKHRGQLRRLRLLRAGTLRRLGVQNRSLALAAAIGALGGLVATAYWFALTFLTGWIWTTGPLARLPLILVCTLGGALVGLLTHWLGSPGEISTLVNNLHLRGGRLDPRENRAMLPISLTSIAFGGSAGPEAPLVQLVGSLGSWLGEKLRLRPREVRTSTLAGMAAALGSFFGAPLGGALFALEIPHRRGLEYYEALLPAIVSACAAFLVLRGLTPAGIGPIWPFPPHELRVLSDVGIGAALGLVGALAAALFVPLFRTVLGAFERLHLHAALRGALGGLLLGLIATARPETLFFSEHQLAEIVVAHHSAWGWLLVALLKALAVGVTLGAGYRGGFIFPLFFIGACVGQAVAVWVPGLDPSLAMLGAMAGINVGVTKTPLATTVLLVSLSGLNLIPVTLFASLAALLATTGLGMIETQQARS